MDNTAFTIRDARLTDAESLLEIYTPYVLNSTYTFETEPPTIEEFRRRIAEFSILCPYLVASGVDGEIIGYAYAHRFKERAAYSRTVENAIYVREGNHRSGVGTALYGELLSRLRVMGYRVCVAGLSMPNDASYAFHKRFGFRDAGTLHNVGYKFGKWLDTAYLELDLTENPVQ